LYSGYSSWSLYYLWFYICEKSRNGKVNIFISFICIYVYGNDKFQNNDNNICGLLTPLYTKDRGKPRTCILTKTHFNTFLIPQFSEGDLTTVRLELNEHTHHTTASFYLAHDDDHYQTPLHNNSYALTHLRNSSLVGTLTHTTQYKYNRSTNTNEWSELLYDYLLQSNLFTCNKVMTQLSSLEIGGKY